MGWILVNILLPITMPTLIMAAMKLGHLQGAHVTRSNLFRTVRDGQQAWIGMTFSASCSYEAWDLLMQRHSEIPDWMGFAVLFAGISLLGCGLMSMLGTLFPMKEPKKPADTWREWMLRYRLFVGALTTTLLTGGLFTAVHFAVPAVRP